MSDHSTLLTERPIVRRSPPLPPMTALQIRELCGRGVRGLASFIVGGDSFPQYFRDSKHSAKGFKLGKNPYFPTATSHAVLALIDIGAHTARSWSTLDESNIYKRFRLRKSSQALIPLHEDLQLPHCVGYFKYNLAASEDAAQTWLEAICLRSSHTGEPLKEEDPIASAELIVHGHVVPAMTFLLDHFSRQDDEVAAASMDDLVKMRNGLQWSLDRVETIIKQFSVAHDLDCDLNRFRYSLLDQC